MEEGEALRQPGLSLLVGGTYHAGGLAGFAVLLLGSLRAALAGAWTGLSLLVARAMQVGCLIRIW